MSDRAQFDAQGFFQALDSVRIARDLNWKQVAAAAAVSQSTLTRLAQGKRPDVDSLAALVRWADLDANAFVGAPPAGAATTEPLAMISTYLRADRSLSPQAADALDRVVKAAYEALRTT
jgi:transcriptional regulator with XRE-family HTH domain